MTSQCIDQLESSQSEQSGPAVGAGGQRSDEIAFVDRFVILTAGVLQRILRY